MNYNFDIDEKNTKRKKIIKEIIILVIEIAITIVLAYVLVNFALEKTTIVGESMETTLQDQDEIIINRFAYHRFSKPKRFDVIVFNQKGIEHSYFNIKRIVGLPGETVQIKAGFIYINGKKINETLPVDKIVNGGLANDKITLDKNEYFVLGDNRNNSEDSRFAHVGNVVSDEIVGKAWIRLKPFAFVNQINRFVQSDKEKKEVTKEDNKNNKTGNKQEEK